MTLEQKKEREERRKQRETLENENEKTEKEAKISAVENEILFENDIITIIRGFNKTLKTFDNKVFNKRFQETLQASANASIMVNNNIIVNVRICNYEKKQIEIKFTESYNSNKYTTYYKLYDMWCGKIEAVNRFYERLRHNAYDYYCVYIDDAFITTETKKERLISKNIEDTLNDYIKNLEKDVLKLKQEIENIGAIIEVEKEIQERYEQLYKENREFQKVHDLDVLTLFDSYYELYSNKVRYH